MTPSAIRQMWISSHAACLPVAGMPMKSPWGVPRYGVRIVYEVPFGRRLFGRRLEIGKCGEQLAEEPFERFTRARCFFRHRVGVPEMLHVVLGEDLVHRVDLSFGEDLLWHLPNKLLQVSHVGTASTSSGREPRASCTTSRRSWLTPAMRPPRRSTPAVDRGRCTRSRRPADAPWSRGWPSPAVVQRFNSTV